MLCWFGSGRIGVNLSTAFVFLGLVPWRYRVLKTTRFFGVWSRGNGALVRFCKGNNHREIGRLPVNTKPGILESCVGLVQGGLGLIYPQRLFSLVWLKGKIQGFKMNGALSLSSCFKFLDMAKLQLCSMPHNRSIVGYFRINKAGDPPNGGDNGDVRNL